VHCIELRDRKANERQKEREMNQPRQLESEISDEKTSRPSVDLENSLPESRQLAKFGPNKEKEEFRRNFYCAVAFRKFIR
jgi:hypothetical protein